jgi:hypothetical protein
MGRAELLAILGSAAVGVVLLLLAILAAVAAAVLLDPVR